MSAGESPWANEALARAVAKIAANSRRIGASFPHKATEGRYDAEAIDWWTNGFWPGLLWLAYMETGDPSLSALAQSCEAALDRALTEFYGLHHDVGFMWTLSATAQYKLLGTESSKRRGLIAASYLASRFNLKGRFVRAWNDDRPGWVIIDSLMNMPLLYWASEVANDPRFRFVAEAHTETVLREFIRPDGSSHHIVCFDPRTGRRERALAGQGYREDSAWSRGQAWALYGLALAYRYTKEPAYLAAAGRVADFFLAGLPEDAVPYCDFKPDGEETIRDSSAAACAASGMLELCRWLPGQAGARYREGAVRILKSLYERYGAWDREDEEGLIVKGAVDCHQKRQVSLIYGDFFFAEALQKAATGKHFFW
ncbi:glycosyl hydrolase [Paenibacillus antri]|uniref:Glycosyl hydrolase n=1 Tax=Paenibacillus antri TaxID=2582848 RepID=A0A5R9GGA7_9BACL|nr:glycoside hydrolase family 88 protein [Paenibacillus antri]TLS53190.1 glycosyl hydrolase [Paenibacillus antri]